MQLEDRGGASVRRRLAAAACVLLAAGAPGAASGQSATPAAATGEAAVKWRFEGSGLLYGEQSRANVVEPVARITRLFSSGQALSAQFTLDAITGASPTGAMPSGTVQTTTSASGQTSTTAANAVPTHPFHDLRGALDLQWVRPIGSLVTITAGGHASREKDYQSLGSHGTLSVDLLHRLTTVTLGGAVYHDGVFPVGGTPVGLADSTVAKHFGTQAKDVTTALAGVSQVLSRRWMLGVTASRTRETGYLTEPYKIVSVLDPTTGLPTGQLTENRPSNRMRNDVLTSSVFHFDSDVFYLSHRYYWDDWRIHSNTLDIKVRHDISQDMWIQPHVRGYEQSSAQFFVFGLTHGPPASLPTYASADDRLGPLRSVTLGATYGFRVPGQPGEFTIRGEYMYQWVSGQPAGPSLQQNNGENENGGTAGGTGGGSVSGTSIGSLLAGYTVQF